MENTPEAAPQNPGTEATNTNTNPAPAEAPAEAPAQPNMHGFTEDQLAEMAKFMEANGGYDKSWKTYKDRISNPAPETKAEQSAQPTQPQEPAQPQEQTSQVPRGYMTPQEWAIRQYYNDLASEDKYSPIADKIRSGEMFKEMGKFGIQPMDRNGNINDEQVREFFDLYAKTVPATPAVSPEASQAPTVDYVAVKDGKIESMDQAARIIAQSSTLTAKGLAAHPNLEAAEAFMKDALSGKKK